MALVVHIATGSRAGQRVRLLHAVCVAGRHPDCELHFDPQTDLDVSGRHAEFRSELGQWTVRDLGSTNGTYVNGRRISTPASLRAGDRVQLGNEGPQIEIVEAGTAEAASLPATSSRGIEPVRPSTAERVAIAVANETSSLRRFVVGLSAVLIVGVGALVWMNQRNAAQSRDTIAMLLARSDSLSAALQRTIDDASGRQAGFDSLARVLQRERADLARRLQGRPSDVSAITTQLDALDRRANQAMALGGANYREIAAVNSQAVAFIAVEEQGGAAFSGTAFAITPGGLLVTNRHVVMDSTGRPPRRLGVWFPGDTTFYPARFVRAADSVDVAFVQVTASRTFPTVRGIASGAGAAAGDAVAVIGYPLGTTLARGSLKQPSLTVGTISKIETSQIQVDAYAAKGSSGSPAFDAQGNVVGILYGGTAESGGRILVLVPSAQLIAQLAPGERSLVR